jgi:hypothetical protein
MVARLSETYAHRQQDSAAVFPESKTAHTVSMGQRLLQRVYDLGNIGIARENVPGISGTPLYLVDPLNCSTDDCFVTGSVFAVVAQDGSICLRLPNTIANDLIENGLCLRAGKNLLTWPPESPHQLEVAWRILLHAYWNASGIPAKRSRRLWSEWVINH